MDTARKMRRLAAAAATTVALTGTMVAPATAGDQAVVDKGIGFLAQIRSQTRGISCAGFKMQASSGDQDIPIPSTRSDYEAAIERNAQSRRDWIDKSSGGMTQAQKDQLEEHLERTRPVVMAKYDECDFGNFEKWSPKPPARTGTSTTSTNKKKPSNTTSTTSNDDSDSRRTTTRANTATTPKPATTNTTKPVSDVERLNAIQKELQSFTDNNKEEAAKHDAGAPMPATTAESTPAPATGTRPTALVMPNMLNPAQPIVIAIPAFVPDHVLANIARMLPAGWSLR